MKEMLKQKHYPEAVSENLIIQELKNELLVYNLKTHRAMSLNETVACVWQLCDGKKSLSEIEVLASRRLETPLPKEAILLSISELDRNNLLIPTASSKTEENIPEISRRQMIRRVALTSAVAIPVITALTAPRAADAQSGPAKLADNQSCTADAECQSDCCLANICSPIGDCFI
jgi:hypothetical protein